MARVKHNSQTGQPTRQVQINMNAPSSWNLNEKAKEMAKVAQKNIEGQTPTKLNSKTWVYKKSI
jgi:hypothetical protein